MSTLGLECQHADMACVIPYSHIALAPVFFPGAHWFALIYR